MQGWQKGIGTRKHTNEQNEKKKRVRWAERDKRIRKRETQRDTNKPTQE